MSLLAACFFKSAYFLQSSFLVQHGAVDIKKVWARSDFSLNSRGAPLDYPVTKLSTYSTLLQVNTVVGLCGIMLKISTWLVVFFVPPQKKTFTLCTSFHNLHNLS